MVGDNLNERYLSSKASRSAAEPFEGVLRTRDGVGGCLDPPASTSSFAADALLNWKLPLLSVTN